MKLQWDTNIGKLVFVVIYVRLVRKRIDGFDVTNDISMVNACSVTCKLLQQDPSPSSTYTSLVKPKKSVWNNHLLRSTTPSWLIQASTKGIYYVKSIEGDTLRPKRPNSFLHWWCFPIKFTRVRSVDSISTQQEEENKFCPFRWSRVPFCLWYISSNYFFFLVGFWFILLSLWMMIHQDSFLLGLLLGLISSSFPSSRNGWLFWRARMRLDQFSRDPA